MKSLPAELNESVSSSGPPELCLPQTPARAPAEGVCILSPGRITQQSTVNVVGGVISQGLKFLVVIYVAHRFSPADFGRFSFAWAVNSFMLVVANFGLPTYGTRQVARNGVVTSALVRAIVFNRFWLALASSAAGVLVLLVVPHLTRTDVCLVGLFGLSNVAQASFLDWAFQGLGRLEMSAILNVLWQALWLLFTVAGVLLGGSVLVIGIALCLSSALAAALSCLSLRRVMGSPSHPVPSTERFASPLGILRSGAALGLGTVLVTVLVWSDSIIVRLLRGAEALAVYAAGSRPEQALGLLLNFQLQGAFPLLRRASEEGGDLFRRCFQRTYNDAAMIFIPAVLWSAIYAPEFLQAIFGKPEYAHATPVFRVFQLTYPLVMLTFLYGNCGLLVFHRDHTYFRGFLAVTGCYLIVCPLLTARWGIQGAAYAIACAFAVLCALFSVKARHLVLPNHAAALTAPVVVGLATGGVGRLLGLSLIPAALVFLAGCAILAAIRTSTVRDLWKPIQQRSS